MACAIGILIVNVGYAGPHHYEFNPDSNTIMYQDTVKAAGKIIASPAFRVDYNPPYTFAVFVTDSGAGNTTKTDSVSISLQKSVDFGQHGSSSIDYFNWTTVAEIVLGWETGLNLDMGQVLPMCVDSCDLGYYDVGGMMRFIMHCGKTAAGDGQDNDTLSVDVTLDAYLEGAGAD